MTTTKRTEQQQDFEPKHFILRLHYFGRQLNNDRCLTCGAAKRVRNVLFICLLTSELTPAIIPAQFGRRLHKEHN